MRKLTIKLDEDLFQKLSKRSNKKGDQMLSQSARELIQLGLRVEESTESIHNNNDENALEKLSFYLKNLLQTHMTWVLETKFLAQFLVENKCGEGANKSLEFMDKAKEKAKSYVNELMEKDKKNENSTA